MPAGDLNFARDDAHLNIANGQSDQKALPRRHCRHVLSGDLGAAEVRNRLCLGRAVDAGDVQGGPLGLQSPQQVREDRAAASKDGVQ